MAEGVTYPIDVLYRTKDQSSAALRAMATASDGAAKSVDGAKRSVDGYSSAVTKAVAQVAALRREQAKLMSSGPHGAAGMHSALLDAPKASHAAFTLPKRRLEGLEKTAYASSKGLKEVAAQAQAVEKRMLGAMPAVSGFGGALGMLAGAAATGGLLYAGKKAFVDFNSGIEMSTISLATQEKMLLGGSWSGAMGNATGLFKDYQQFAAKAVGETQDFIDMHAAIAASAYKAGLGMEDLKSMTKGATVAAIALGERADQVSLDIKQMLAGRVEVRDRTAQTLLASQGVSQESFNAMNAKQRNKIIIAGLNDPALKSAATAYGKTWAGATSAFSDNLKISLGKVGMPLFKAITKEVQRWNAWIEKNPQKIREFANTFASALKDGFNAVKDAMSWVAKHKDVLMALAKAVLVMKGARLLGGLVGGAVQGGIGMIGNGIAAGGATVGLAGAGAAAGMAVTGVGLGVGAGLWANDRIIAGEQKYGESAGMREALAHSIALYQKGERSKEQVLLSARDAGFFGKTGMLRHGSAFRSTNDYFTAGDQMIGGGETQQIIEMFDEIRGILRTMPGIADRATQALYGFQAALPGAIGAGWSFLNTPGSLAAWTKGLETEENKKKSQNKPKIEVNINNTIVSDDPDRIAVPISQAVRRALSNPGGARKAITAR